MSDEKQRPDAGQGSPDPTLVDRIVARLRAEAATCGASDDAEIYVYGPPNMNRAADIVAQEFAEQRPNSAPDFAPCDCASCREQRRRPTSATDTWTQEEVDKVKRDADALRDVLPGLPVTSEAIPPAKETPDYYDRELAGGIVEERTSNASGMQGLVDDIAEAIASARAQGRAQRTDYPTPDEAFEAGWTAACAVGWSDAFGNGDSDTPRTLDDALLEWKTRPSQKRSDGQ